MRDPAAMVPVPASPLTSHWRPGHRGTESSTPVAISERGLAFVQLTARRGQADAVQSALASVTGLDLPAPGHTASARELVAVWVQPRSWLLMQPLRSGSTLARVLEAACGSMASVVDLTGGRLTLRLSGTRARDVLAKGCPVDLHPRAFGPGRAAATSIGHVDTLVIQVDEASTFDLIVGSTYAANFLNWLQHAAAEYGYEMM